MASGEAPPELGAIYAEHAAFVRRVLADRGVASSDLDDATQETFVTVHRRLPEFEGRAAMQTWLYAVAWRVAANYRRRGRRAVLGGKLGSDADESAQPLLSPERLHASFAWVDPENRDLLALHEIGELSISALSEMTGNARATIRHRIERGRGVLRRVFGQDGVHSEHNALIEAMEPRLQRPRPPLPDGTLQLSSDRLVCISTFGDIVIGVWRGPSSNHGLTLVSETLIDLAHATPTGIRYLSVVERTSSPPTREGRELSTWCARKLGPQVKAVAVMVEGEALKSLVAAVLNTSLYLAGSPITMRFFGELPATLAWLANGGALDSQRLVAHLERMRASLAPAPKRLWRATQSG